MLTFPFLDALSDGTDHIGGGRGHPINCSGWKLGLFLDMFSEENSILN